MMAKVKIKCASQDALWCKGRSDCEKFMNTF